MEKPTWFNAIILGFFINLSSAQFAFPNEESDIPNFGRCLTANNERALCIILQDCKYLWNLLNTEPLKDEDRFYLSRSQCGYQNGKVLICCPDRYRQVKPAVVKPSPRPTGGGGVALPQPGQCGNVLANRIYGGNLTKIDEYPWMAQIEYTKPGGSKGHHCGGSLISQRYVITASHCVNGRGIPTDWRLSGVRLGEWDTDTNPDCEVDVRGQKDCAPPHLDVPVERSIPHPQYNPSSKNQVNDIALLRLSRDIAYTDFIRPICLPLGANLRSSNYEGIVMDVAGWGKTEVSQASTLKLKATVAIVPLEECRRVYGAQKINLESSQICAGGQKRVDSCRGDSGGPLIGLDTSNRARNYNFLSGVVSFGPSPCGLEGWPGVYTRVSDFVDWIQATIN